MIFHPFGTPLAYSLCLSANISLAEWGISLKMSSGDKMYCNFFGFNIRPFELTPDSNFLYLSHELKEIIATLKYGIIQRRGFILVAGKPGTGKTTLINSLMDRSDIDANFAYIFNPDLNFKEFLHAILIEFDLASVDEDLSKTRAIHRLKLFVNEQFGKDRNTVIIVDEAQCLEAKMLEKLRLLSNLETRKHKLLQIILCGQPELENTLSQKNLIQLAQRIGLRCRTEPLNEKDAYEYIDHRLKIAGYSSEPLFANKAKYLIWTFSKGIPRTINIICDNSLLYAYSADLKRIDSSIVKEVIDDFNKVPLETLDNSHEKNKDKINEVPQTPFIQSNEMCEVLPDSSENKTDYHSGIIDKLRRKLSFNQDSEISVRRERKYSATLVAVIAGVVLMINFSILFLFAGNFKEFRKDFSSKLEAMKNSLQYHSDGDPKSVKQTPADSKLAVNKSPAANNSGIEGEGEKNTIVVRRGETLHNIIVKVYGENNPKIFKAVLKINPEIKNPDLIRENQVIKLPDKMVLN
jgi:type II secretory pathway predicted ATPase ExeA/phage tail protein X